MIKVLVVDDSAVARGLLLHILNADPAIEVVGTARNGEEAIATVARLRPDLVTMDINMPLMDGFEATRRIMQTTATPIVIVSGRADAREVAMTFRALEAGALTILARPAGIGHPDHAADARELVRTVKLMSEVKVIRRWAARGATAVPARPAPVAEALAVLTALPRKLIVIGASTGGPPVLRDIIAALPAGFPVPVVIVQHIAAGFTEGFVQWLAGAACGPVQVPSNGDFLRAGHIYIAAEGRHLGISPAGHAVLHDAPPEHGMRPAVSYLFRSVAASFGPAAVGVLLTGMGTDGSAELKALRDTGAVTIAQDAASSVVHGMPGEAIRLGGATYVCPADAIANLLVGLVQSRMKGREDARPGPVESTSGRMR